MKKKADPSASGRGRPRPEGRDDSFRVEVTQCGLRVGMTVSLFRSAQFVERQRLPETMDHGQADKICTTESTKTTEKDKEKEYGVAGGALSGYTGIQQQSHLLSRDSAPP